MAALYTIIGQSAPSATTATILFTPVTAHQYVISTLVISNTSTAAVNASVYTPKGSTTASAATNILNAVVIPANSTLTLTLGITLNGTAPADNVYVQTSVANSLTFTAYGSDITA